jgi:cytochrome c oxidase subunit 2
LEPPVNALHPHGPGAAHEAGLFWLMLILGSVIYAVVMTLLMVAVFRRHSEGKDNGFILGGGVVLPTIVLMVLAYATVHVTNEVSAAVIRPLRIEVVGYQYWWRVEYPGTAQAVTANEIHIPVGTPVEIGLRSVDVIHSFWVPELAGKMDLIPGQRNVLTITADKAGTYRGQCAEFCGLQHAHMAFLVIAEAPARFDAWLADQARPSTGFTGLAGQADFEKESCAGCHTVRGTSADGTVGPDLTHLMSRTTIGALTARNTHDNLAAWVADAQSMKQGALMPPIPLKGSELDDLITYLETLR